MASSAVAGAVQVVAGNATIRVDQQMSIRGNDHMVLDQNDHPIFIYNSTVDSTTYMLRCNDELCAGGDDKPVAIRSETQGTPRAVLNADDGLVLAFADNFAVELMYCLNRMCEQRETHTISGAAFVYRVMDIGLGVDGYPIILTQTSNGLSLIVCDDAPCESFSEITRIGYAPDDSFFHEGTLRIDAQGRPVVVSSSATDSVTLLLCNDAKCAGDDEEVVEIPGTFQGADLTLHETEDGSTDIIVNAIKNDIVDAAGSYTQNGLRVWRCPREACGSFEEFDIDRNYLNGWDPSMVMTENGLLLQVGIQSFTYEDGLNNQGDRIVRVDLDQGEDYDQDLHALELFARDRDDDHEVETTIVQNSRGNIVLGVVLRDGFQVIACGDVDCVPECAGEQITVDLRTRFLPTERDDVLRGTAGKDTISGRGGDDLICGLGGNDLLIGGDGNDHIFGGAGSDVIDGRSGRDRIVGGPDNDQIVGGPGNDRLFGGLGRDTIYGWSGNDRVSGGGGPDTLYGGFGADNMFGNLGNDTIDGDGGGDIIRGGFGADTIDGDSGEDRCGFDEKDRSRIDCERGVFGI